MFKTILKVLPIPVAFASYYYWKKQKVKSQNFCMDGSKDDSDEFSKYDFSESLSFLKTDNLNGWKFCTEKRGVKVYYKKLSEDDNFFAYKGIGTCKSKPDEVIDLLGSLEVKVRKKFDPLVLKIELIKEYEPNKKKTSYVRYKSPARLLFCDRDFVLAGSVIKEGNTTFFPLISITHKAFPDFEKKNIVRGNIVKYGWVLKYDETKNETEIIYISCCDLKGSLPTWFINLTAAKQPELVCFFIICFNSI